MKCQILFSGKNKKNNIILSSAENAQRVVKVNYYRHCINIAANGEELDQTSHSANVPFVS